MATAGIVNARSQQQSGWGDWPGRLPLLALPMAVIAFRSLLAPWLFMWALAFAVFVGFKWLTWWQARDVAGSVGVGRSLAYLLAWPGMDARAFLSGTAPARPRLGMWIIATLQTGFGAVLLWGVARLAEHPLLAGWIGMFMLLHLGVFRLLALFWQSQGVDARPLFRAPILATSLSEFWSKRWNLAFRDLSHELLFRPLVPRAGVKTAMFLTFLASGLLHDLIISLPAGGGYGLPTAYFMLQGLGVLFERSRLGRRLGLGRGLSGWLFTAMTTAGLAFFLFHPPFVENVIVPFLHVIHAL